jgi:hypothetical protein
MLQDEEKNLATFTSHVYSNHNLILYVFYVFKDGRTKACLWRHSLRSNA